MPPWPPIHKAALNGNLEEVMRLTQQDPQLVHSRDRYTRSPPLHLASFGGHVEVVVWLLGHGAHINERDGWGETPFTLACRQGCLQVVELLLREGADPTTTAEYGVTPLMLASESGKRGVVRCLLNNPQAVSTLDHRHEKEGSTALYQACSESDDDDDDDVVVDGVVRDLLEAGADPTIATYEGVTPVDEARRRGRDVCVELFEEWDRNFLLTKARHLSDVSHAHAVSQALTHRPSSSPSSSPPSSPPAKRARLNMPAPIYLPPPTYLMGRVDKGEPLPQVEMAPLAGGCGRAHFNLKVKEMDDGLLVWVVLEHVVCGGLNKDLFVELGEMMGTTWCRKEIVGGDEAVEEESDSSEDDYSDDNDDDDDDDDDDEEEEEEKEEDSTDDSDDD